MQGQQIYMLWDARFCKVNSFFGSSFDGKHFLNKVFMISRTVVVVKEG